MPIDTSKLVFCTGAPGSMWSRIIKELANCASVDNSDCNETRVYPDFNHFGNYFGPHMEFGEYFFELDESTVTRDEFLRELGKPYAKEYGDSYRLLKSHAFSYNLNFIDRLLPESRMLLIWRDNDQCFDWWMYAGGFNISYPNYLWYQNEYIMKQQIAAENQGILDFAEEKKIELAAMSLEQIARRLGLIGAVEDVKAEWQQPLPYVLMGIR